MYKVLYVSTHNSQNSKSKMHIHKIIKSTEKEGKGLKTEVSVYKSKNM
jgi:hypothetical protein